MCCKNINTMCDDVSNLPNLISPGQNGRHLADILKRIFTNEEFCIFIQISLKFVLNGPINKKSVLIQVKAWRRIGDKPLPEPMLIQFTDVHMSLGEVSWKASKR